MLDAITPVLLTFNEEQNISRTLSHLDWAKDIVVVDSGSTDKTLEILARFSNVRVFTRLFDSHARQWKFALEETGIASSWVLRLDADYQVTNELVSELARLDSSAPLSAYRIGFIYSIFSRPLLCSLYPPNVVLLRKERVSVIDQGHTERWEVVGPVASLKGRIVHDDRKSLSQWLEAQARYMKRELDQISGSASGMKRWLRMRPPLMPIGVFLYCLFGKGLIFSGRAGLFYALQRTIAEAILSLMLLERRLRSRVEENNADICQRAPQKYVV
jgi:glycosyltransferase involved in cell wall biosynthesis